MRFVFFVFVFEGVYFVFTKIVDADVEIKTVLERPFACSRLLTIFRLYTYKILLDTPR